MNGLNMLIEQAAVSFELWFNISLGNKDIEEVKKFVKNPIKIAITGKIGSGKSTVSEIIKTLVTLFLNQIKKLTNFLIVTAQKNKIKNLFTDKIKQPY